MTRVSVISLFSGSDGNCTAVVCGNDTLLIDAGRSARAIGSALDAAGIAADSVRAVFITHEHSDHISALRVFTKKYRVPVYAAAGTADTVSPLCSCGAERCQPLFSEHIGDMTISSFPTSHDAACPVGYRIDINTREGSHASVGIATDTGIVTDGIRRGLCGCRAVVLESNHDVGMLMSGPYPPQLKQRISSARGHLSNDDSASLAAELALGGTESIILAHISKENNLPDIALDTCLRRLAAVGCRADVLAARRDASVGVTFEI